MPNRFKDFGRQKFFYYLLGNYEKERLRRMSKEIRKSWQKSVINDVNHMQKKKKNARELRCLRLRNRKCNGESLFRRKLMKNISYIDTRCRIRYNCTVSSPAARHRLFLGLFIGKHLLLSLPPHAHTHTYKSWCLSLSRGFSGPADCAALSFWFSLDMCNEKAMLSSGCMYLTDASLCIYLCSCICNCVHV